MYQTLHKFRKHINKHNPRLEKYSDYLFYDTVFTEEECDKIIENSQAFEAYPAEVVRKGKSKVDPNARISLNRKLNCTDDTEWIFERLDGLTKSVNRQFYNYDLTGLTEDIRLLEYGPGGHFKWHQDFYAGVGSTRKLSIAIQLSDPKEYEGGVFQFFSNGIIETPRKKGMVTIFPSYVHHKVTPVTSGKRYTLVAWVNGPHFT